jgi:hypothetical protein
MACSPTFLAPGQRYAEMGVPDWRAEDHLVIVLVRPDLDGVLHVACGRADGRGIVEPVAAFEAHVVAGILRPVSSFGGVARC